MTPEFQAWPKIARWNKPVTITEKIDGTNACVIVTDEGAVWAQSRKRIITPQQDNFGFAEWAQLHAGELAEGLGPGYHYGEWWGQGIQRGYGQETKRFSLFNVDKWGDERPDCCDVVPVLVRASAASITDDIEWALHRLRYGGSAAAAGFMNPEGIVVWHSGARALFKATLDGDDHKGAED